MAIQAVKWSESLNNVESEAIPLQRIRCGQDVVSPFCRRHLAMLSRDELDIGGFGDGVPDDVCGIGVLEPTVVGVVPTKVRVDDVGHRTDIAPPRDIPGDDAQP